MTTNDIDISDLDDSKLRELEVPDTHTLCWSHMKLEFIGAVEPHVICFECGHVYRTKHSLKMAYIREHKRFGKCGEDVLGKRYPYTRFELVKMYFTTRAKNISFCQECVHDF